MSRSSNETVVFGRKPINATLTLHDRVRPERPGGTRTRIDIKELQRRAYERGREVERQQTRAPAAELLAAMRAAHEEARAARATDEARIEAFAVELASLVAERLVGRVVAEDRHDVRAMLDEILSEVRDGLDTEALEVRVSPEDHQRLAAGEEPPDFEGFQLRVDPSIARGSFVVTSLDTTYYATLSERIEVVRARLLEEGRRVEA